ncbi:BMC domain-containing protein [Clostridium uliginosum]|uniref:BMC domain-containing protein n=1 Tax=Clostridium uliginosum TaxID=119641 RepID=A0A1I1H5B1_9CLOT|nr:BMC domain-containing protein [Clostridium uliginosum]SFC18752.1 BMC domain-containing protein [Clostridium uliginosum]
MDLENFALGLIETVGLVAAIEAADTAIKSSNVELIGYENSKGGTMVVKIKGDVGAVNAAIQSAFAAAQRVNKVLSTAIIPRPNAEIKDMIFTNDTVGVCLQDENKNPVAKDLKIQETELQDKVFDEKLLNNKKEEVTVLEEKPNKTEPLKQEKKEICNLCMDPKCSRKKGDVRISCIHYNEIKK